MNESLDRAIDTFREILGPEHVVADRTVPDKYRTATFAIDRRIPAVIRPGSRDEVQRCMRVATAYRVPVYPLSTGRNIGYGSAVPTADDCVVMELSRMRGLSVNVEHAYAVVEPGVTQEQLFRYLREQNIPLWMDATGAPADHSILGNTVERGFGHTPYGDHFGNVGGMEIVLANGDSFRTGFGRYPRAKAYGVYRWGVGPYVDGLFTQSNFGIVTEMTIWLMPAPAYVQKFFFGVERHDDLGTLIDLLRPFRLDGTLRSAVHVVNDYKSLNAISRYPWDLTGGQTPLRPETLRGFAASLGFNAWNASGALYGTRAEVALARRRLKRALRGKVKQLRFLDERTLTLVERFSGPLSLLLRKDVGTLTSLLRPTFGLTRGEPSNHFLKSTYWRKRQAAAALTDPNPDRDRCGQLWLAPIAPLSGRHAQTIYRIAAETMLQHGFEPMASITLLTPRAMDCVLGISYDRDVPGEDDRALDCHETLLDRLMAEGYYPYRLSLASMGRLPPPQSGYAAFHSAVKSALDPSGILAPGRYEESREAAAEPLAQERRFPANDGQHLD